MNELILLICFFHSKFLILESEKVSLAENYLQLSVILTRILNSDGSGSQEVEENSDMTRTSI